MIQYPKQINIVLDIESSTIFCNTLKDEEISVGLDYSVLELPEKLVVKVLEVFGQVGRKVETDQK